MTFIKFIVVFSLFMAVTQSTASTQQFRLLPVYLRASTFQTRARNLLNGEHQHWLSKIRQVNTVLLNDSSNPTSPYQRSFLEQKLLPVEITALQSFILSKHNSNFNKIKIADSNDSNVRKFSFGVQYLKGSQLNIILVIAGAVCSVLIFTSVNAARYWHIKRADREVLKVRTQAKLLLSEGHNVRAIAFLTSSLPLVIQLRGGDTSHVDVAALRHYQAKAHMALGQWAQGEALAAEVVRSYEALGQDVHLAGATEDLGVALQQQGKTEESIAALRRSLHIFSEEAALSAKSSPLCLGGDGGSETPPKKDTGSVEPALASTDELLAMSSFSSPQQCARNAAAEETDLASALSELESMLYEEQEEQDRVSCQNGAVLPETSGVTIGGLSGDANVARLLRRVAAVLMNRPDHRSLTDVRVHLQSALQIYRGLGPEEHAQDIAAVEQSLQTVAERARLAVPSWGRRDSSRASSGSDKTASVSPSSIALDLERDESDGDGLECF